jgi:hypothetical protein
MSLFLLPAAAVTVLGPSWGVPGIAAIGGSYTTSIVLGAGLALIGFAFGRTADFSDTPRPPDQVESA